MLTQRAEKKGLGSRGLIHILWDEAGSWLSCWLIPQSTWPLSSTFYPLMIQKAQGCRVGIGWACVNIPETHPGQVELWDHLELAEEETSSKEERW